MNVFGKDRGFLMTVGASAEIAKLCPDNRLENWGQLLTGADDVTTIENRARLIVALNAGFESNKAFTEPGYKAEPLTVAQVLALPSREFLALLSEALEATKPKREIESEPLKKNGEEK